MFTKQQEKLLNKFANLSDKLFELGIITTDSFTGEIGEYIACKHFNLSKTERVTRAIDGICKLGNKYQVKSKIVSGNNFSYNLTELDSTCFQYLVIVYFDKNYSPLKLLRIPSKKIINGAISISPNKHTDIEIFESSAIEISKIDKIAIAEFANAYNDLEEYGIIRSRRIVGDIGEFYACMRLGLTLNDNKNEKGIDAKHSNGLTFEIKTRRVYESGRRVSETRRLNNLVGKTADFLIVVTLNHSFICSGMWIVPMKNLTNPKSANLKVVNTTPGTKNLIASKISWLNTGEIFNQFKP